MGCLISRDATILVSLRSTRNNTTEFFLVFAPLLWGPDIDGWVDYISVRKFKIIVEADHRLE